MPHKMPPFVTCQISRHGKRMYYFRRKKGKRTRLPELGTDAFWPAYQSALMSHDPPKQRPIGVNSLEWLIARYRESSQYRALKPATRRQRDNIFKGIIAKSGSAPFSAIARKHIVQGREDRAATPSQARNFLDAMRGLFRWALDIELVQVDPTASVKNPKQPKGDGFKAWTRDDIAAFEQKWPSGTRQRVWLHVLLYTGLRRGDAVLSRT